MTAVASIAKECLKDENILHEFWEQDFNQKIGLYDLLDQLLQFFPYKNEELTSLLEILIGNGDHQYAENIIHILSNLNTYTVEQTLDLFNDG